METEEWEQLMSQEGEYLGETYQAIYSDLLKLQPMDMEEEPTEIYFSVSGQHYSKNTSAVTCNQTESDLMDGTTADQLLAKEIGAYLKQQDVDPDTVHTVTATHSLTTNTSMSDAEWYLQNFELAPYQMESDLKHGTATDQLHAKESGAYLKQEAVDPDMVHAITATESHLTHRTTTDQLLAKGSGAYLKQEAVNPDTVHTVTATHSVTTNTFLSSNEWLLQNFEFSPNLRLPCSTMYKLYLHHCNKDKLKPLSRSLLGKVIRSVFSHVKKRRLGKRGNKKSHYCGICLIPGSAVSKLAEEEDLVDCQKKPVRRHKFWSRSGVSGTGILKTGNKHEENANSSVGLCHFPPLQQDPHPHLYPGDLPEAVPDFPDIEFILVLPENCTWEIWTPFIVST
ncbi:transcription factor RFX3-like [Cryptotermes secundus]|uniref:transcription factor RFX3-like n=1 Tax=Cryptotermes secundus TaxID=105785 RepID=UPI000CD7B34A|nr:transcription factor RFX3-like [Cryptotermes secundus]